MSVVCNGQVCEKYVQLKWNNCGTLLKFFNIKHVLINGLEHAKTLVWSVGLNMESIFLTIP